MMVSWWVICGFIFCLGVAVSTFFSDRGVLWPTINALDMVYNIGLPIHDMDKLDALRKSSMTILEVYWMVAC
jgi:hypothetical protein